jgi:hypothetical protein
MAKPHGGGGGDGYGRPMLMGLFLLACIITHQHLSVRVNHRPQRIRSSKRQAEPAAKAVPEVAARAPFPTDPAHPVLYLIQLEGTTPLPSVGGADSLCVSWKREMAPCDFAAGSSWTQGRNHLWKKATLLEKKYMYYVFMDEDIQLSNLTEFEELLLKYQPPIGVPAGIAQIAGTPPAYNMVILHSFDAAFDAFHYDVMHDSMVLPYSDLFDKFSWWASQLFMIYLCQIFYNNEVVGFLGVTSANAQHRPYPRGWNMSALDTFFKQQIIADDLLRQDWRGYSWTTGGQAMPKLGTQRYLVPEEFLPLRDSESIYWKRIAQIKASADGRPPLANLGIDITGEDFQKNFGIK